MDLISKAIQIDERDSPETVKEKIESSIDALLGEKENSPLISAVCMPLIIPKSPK